MHGGNRAKYTSFLSTSSVLESLCLWSFGVTVNMLSDGSFSTATEAKYTTLLSERVAAVVVSCALDKGYVAPATLDQSTHLQLNALAVHRQPTKSMPPYLFEFAYVTEVLVTKAEPVLDQKGKLLKPFRSVPAVAKRLKMVRKRVGNDFGIFMMFGVYRKPSQFVEEVEKFPHQFDMFCDVPDCVLKLIFLILTKGPVGMAKHRMRKIGQWRKWLSELEPQEKALHEGMDAEVGLVFEA